MRTGNPSPANIDEYIAGFPRDVQKMLRQVRRTIREAAPAAEERISYGIAGFALNGRVVVHFAGYKTHIALSPAPRGVESFKKALSSYKGGKGTVQFPLNEPLPLGLITRIVKFRVKENAAKAQKKPRV